MKKKKYRQLYYRFFIIYTSILVATVGILMVFFISSSKARIKDTSLDYMRMLSEEAVSYVEGCASEMGYIKGDLYQSAMELEDLLSFLKLDEESYRVKRLEEFIASPALKYNGFEKFIIKILESYPNIQKIDLISYERMESTTASKEGIKNRVSISIEEMETLEEKRLENKDRFFFIQEVRNPDTMESVGAMIVYFDSNVFGKLKDYYSKAELIIRHSKGAVIFNSSEGGKNQPFLQIEDGNNHVSEKVAKNYIVTTFINKREANRLPMPLLFTVLGIGIVIIGVGVIWINISLQKLAKRLHYILDGMKKVTTGDLKVRLEYDSNGDELDLISKNFNSMCIKLDRYIQKSYLAEIEQKGAELNALQNQINPHFLYNTLEVIRMKAICNKDKDVANMLYSMSVIFRSQLKDSDMITVAQEIHYCKKYLELFEYRYQKKFTSRVVCAEEYKDYPIIKFLLQPVIENYFIHGIYGEKEGNELCIRVDKSKSGLVIHVVDNGKGMSMEDIEEKNRELRENDRTDKKSIGLGNVNARIKAVYGEEYGVSVKQSDLGGMHVILTLGMGEDYEKKKSDVSGR